MTTIKAGLGAALCLAPLVASAQEVRDCDGYAANARFLMMLSATEPAVRSFANGEVRAIGLDTVEPACCWAHLMVDFMVADEPFPHCMLVSADGGEGFSGLRFSEMTARYDPAVGLILTVPAGRFDGALSVSSPLEVIVNRATGTVTARHF